LLIINNYVVISLSNGCLIRKLAGNGIFAGSYILENLSGGVLGSCGEVKAT
jgi:hypothetical protein